MNSNSITNLLDLLIEIFFRISASLLPLYLIYDLDILNSEYLLEFHFPLLVLILASNTIFTAVFLYRQLYKIAEILTE
jgi:hypothetical protein